MPGLGIANFFLQRVRTGAAATSMWGSGGGGSFRRRSVKDEFRPRPRQALLTATQLSACCLVFEVIQSVAAIKTPDAMKVR